MVKGLKKTFLQRGYTNGQEAHENMLSITNHLGNANQSHNEIPSHTHWHGYLKQQKITSVGEDVEN